MSDKVTISPKISLVENDEIISDEFKLANAFSNFFEIAVHSLGIKTSGIKTNEYSNDNYSLKNPVDIAIKKLSTIRVSILLKKILQTKKASIFYQLSRRVFKKKLLTLITKKKKKKIKKNNIPTRCGPILANAYLE